MKAALALLSAALLAAGCATGPKPPEKPSPYYSDDGPPDKLPDNLAQVPDAVPRDEVFHRFANRPYTVFGQAYVPVVNSEPYKERGMASWYGRKFQGQRTASGEPYDMFAMTAAHKTLPIPSFARVTNVANGKSVVVRINDRGPFHGNRIIDLSYAAASRIGLAAKGSGMVEVERVFEATQPEVDKTLAPPTAAKAGNGAATAVKAAAPEAAPDAGMLWIQLGAFSSAEAASAFRERATRELPWILEPIDVVQRDGLHRVRLGPYRKREEADAIAEKVHTSLGVAPAITNR